MMPAALNPVFRSTAPQTPELPKPIARSWLRLGSRDRELFFMPHRAATTGEFQNASKFVSS
jgi:hypothetical protein